MDETRVKRLLITLAVSIAVILALKTVLLKTALKVNKHVAEKKQPAPPKPEEQQAPMSPASLTVDTPASSPAGETPSAAAPAASGVSVSQ